MEPRGVLAAALGLQHVVDATWHKRAACAGYPLSLFFPERGSNHSDVPTIQEDRAKRICARCPVRRECLNESLAIESPQNTIARSAANAERSTGFAGRPIERALPVGIFGGHTPAERWFPKVTHLDDCERPKHRRGCRPIPERVELLEVRLKEKSHRFLLASERVMR